ncbi:MAG: acyl dehydratase [Planctomycetes bacterium]|nr:acyl dehydratase [Planctomycetota bacterium]
MTAASLAFADIQVGMAIPELACRPTNLNLFQFAAVTWQSHRIHYDKDYAVEEGYSDVVLQASLHGAYLGRLLTEWAHPNGRILELEWTNRRYATVGETLTFRGVVIERYERAGQGIVVCELTEENTSGEVITPARATLVFDRPAAGAG